MFLAVNATGSGTVLVIEIYAQGLQMAASAEGRLPLSAKTSPPTTPFRTQASTRLYWHTTLEQAAEGAPVR